MPSATSPSAIDELRLRLAGGVHEPGDPQYEETCTLFNAMIDRRPRLVARCAAPDDVVAALAFARARDLPVAVRGGGHSVAGRSLCDDGVVLDVRPMDDVAVDPERRVARVGGGATWAQLDRATQAHGLATTGGRVSSTGVAGLTMGGGSGWLERKHGLACDNLIAAELVAPDGRLVRASAEEHPELLWALRGGGGNFGVVTALELALHPVGPEVLAGVLAFPVERARETLAAWRDVMREAPEELSLAWAWIPIPEDDDFPRELQGRHAILVAGMHAGELADAERAIAPLRALGPAADLFAPTPYAEFQCALDDPPGLRNRWGAENVPDLPPDAIEEIVAWCEDLPPSLSQMFIVAWGGAVARADASTSPLAGRDAAFVVHPLLMWEDPAQDAAMGAAAGAFRERMRPWACEQAFLNFLGDEAPERVRSAFGERNAERLARLKAEWDPQDVLRGHQRVVAAAG